MELDDCSECLCCLKCIKEAKEKENSESFVKKLIEKGMNPNYITPNGRTALMTASMFGSKKGVEELLKYGANPFIVDDYGMTALDFAKTQHHTEIVKILEKRMKTRKRPRPVYRN